MSGEFVVVVRKTASALSEEVNRLIGEGWQPQGSMHLAPTQYLSINMVKGSNSQVTEFFAASSQSRGGVINLINEKLSEGFQVFNDLHESSSQFTVAMVKGDTGVGGGAIGPQGPQGVQGPQGKEGPQGAKGDTGAAGETGARGPMGLQGVQGNAGATGPQGPAGPQGKPGIDGAQGIQGNQGSQGPQGEKGDPGEVGPAGISFKGAWVDAEEYAANDAVAYNGSTWFAVIGNTNEIPGSGSSWQILSSRGVRGDTGATGSQGPAGPQGIQGLKGEQGIQGEQGIKGDAGAAGPTGEAGPQCIQGVAGPQGVKGETGAQGLTGPKGDAGIQGAKGDTGPQGAKGDKGDKGDTGPQGPRGDSGGSSDAIIGNFESTAVGNDYTIQLPYPLTDIKLGFKIDSVSNYSFRIFQEAGYDVRQLYGSCVYTNASGGFLRANINTKSKPGGNTELVGGIPASANFRPMEITIREEVDKSFWRITAWLVSTNNSTVGHSIIINARRLDI